MKAANNFIKPFEVSHTKVKKNLSCFFIIQVAFYLDKVVLNTRAIRIKHRLTKSKIFLNDDFFIEEIYRNDSSVKDIIFHRKIAVLIPDISSYKQHLLSKVYMFDILLECAKPILWSFLYFRVSSSVVDCEIIIQ